MRSLGSEFHLTVWDTHREVFVSPTIRTESLFACVACMQQEQATANGQRAEQRAKPALALKRIAHNLYEYKARKFAGHQLLCRRRGGHVATLGAALPQAEGEVP